MLLSNVQLHDVCLCVLFVMCVQNYEGYVVPLVCPLHTVQEHRSSDWPVLK